MHRTSDDVNDLHGAKRYLVWHSTGKHDGDTAFASLAEAEAEFDHQCNRSGVVEVELQDITIEDDPFVICRRSLPRASERTMSNTRDIAADLKAEAARILRLEQVDDSFTASLMHSAADEMVVSQFEF